MLRSAVTVLAALAVLASGVAVLLSGATALAPFGFSVLLLVGTAWERVHYKRLAPAAPEPRFRPTAERFRDPTTGEPVTVYADPSTGERAYVRD